LLRAVHRLQVAGVAVDDTEVREDGSLVRSAVEIAHDKSANLCL
jgi:hypothetical protein